MAILWCCLSITANAARQRYASCPPSVPAHEDVVTLPHQNVRPLLQTVMRHVSGRICDTRHPITGLQGLPAQLASRVLQHLVKERLLYPRTLQPFISWWVSALVEYIISHFFSLRLWSALVIHYRFFKWMSVKHLPQNYQCYVLYVGIHYVIRHAM